MVAEALPPGSGINFLLELSSICLHPSHTKFFTLYLLMDNISAARCYHHHAVQTGRSDGGEIPFQHQVVTLQNVENSREQRGESLCTVVYLTVLLVLRSSSSWDLRSSCSKEPSSSLNKPTSSQFFRKRVGVGV